MDKLNNWLGLVANLGVVAGIVFLAYEIRLTRDALVGATYQQRTEMVEAWDFNIANSDHVFAAIGKYAEAGAFKDLPKEDQARIEGISIAAFNRMDNFYYQYELGLMSEEMYRHAFQAEMAMHVPRWVDMDLFNHPYVKRALRPSFQQEVSKYADAELNIF